MAEGIGGELQAQLKAPHAEVLPGQHVAELGDPRMFWVVVDELALDQECVAVPLGGALQLPA